MDGVRLAYAALERGMGVVVLLHELNKAREDGAKVMQHNVLLRSGHPACSLGFLFRIYS